MPMSVRYTTVDGQVLCENRGGVKTLFMPDTLGNVIETRNMDTGAQTSSTTYWPYGEVRTQTGTNPSPFGFCGVWGYYTQTGQPTYVRARYYRPNLGRWQTVDPLWPAEATYNYTSNQPTFVLDPAGLAAFGGKTVGCPPVVTSSLNALCTMLRGFWKPNSINDINECVAKSSAKLGIACPSVTPSLIRCLGNFCETGYVGCNDPRIDCSRAVGRAPSCTIPDDGGHNLGTLIAVGWIIGYIPIENPMGGILICPDSHKNGRADGLGGVPGISDTLLHEMLHTCGVGHGKPPGHRPDLQPGGNESCNGVLSCCIYNIQVKGRGGNRCWESAKWR